MDSSARRVLGRGSARSRTMKSSPSSTATRRSCWPVRKTRLTRLFSGLGPRHRVPEAQRVRRERWHIRRRRARGFIAEGPSTSSRRNKKPRSGRTGVVELWYRFWSKRNQVFLTPGIAGAGGASSTAGAGAGAAGVTCVAGATPIVLAGDCGAALVGICFEGAWPEAAGVPLPGAAGVWPAA
jgi:hypothetical protein